MSAEADTYENSPRRKKTLADVAVVAGVSLSTVSKALNHQPRISEATRIRVLQAARQVGYITDVAPNPDAYGLPGGFNLSTERSNSIGVLTSDLIGRWGIPILIGAEDELGGSNSSVLLDNARGDSTLELNALRSFAAKNVDGILVAGQETNPRASLRDHTNIPLVYAYAPSDDPEDCSVTSDNVGAGRLAVEHLLSCGKSKIAIIGGSETFVAAPDRLKGSLDALHEHGLEPAGPVRFNEWSEGWGRAATRLLLDQKVDFDGVICQNDQIARGCLTALVEAGLSIPRDVAVIGHDDWQVLTLESMPPLTSIDNCVEEIGHIAVRRLLDAINGNPHHGVEYVPCRLVQRESTLPLR